MHPLAWILLALALTILVECGLSLFFRSRQLTYSVLLCNLLTNPLLNLLLLLYLAFIGQESYFVVVGILELAAVAVEAYVIKLMTGRRRLNALGLSLLFNSASFGAGLLLGLVLSL